MLISIKDEELKLNLMDQVTDRFKKEVISDSNRMFDDIYNYISV